jgi:hypothetical protein
MDRPGLDRLLNEDLPKLRIHAQEDPLEQPFISRVVTREGEFHFVSGMYDQAADFTDVVVSAFQTLDGLEAARAFEAVIGLLRLSDALVERSGEMVWSLGPDTPAAPVRLPGAADLAGLAARTVFTDEDLSDLGLDSADLEPFRLTEDDRRIVAESPIGDSPLERRPLWRDGSDWIVIAPGAISTAIRAFLIDAAVANGLAQRLQAAMLLIQHDRLNESGFVKDEAESIVNRGGQPALDRLIELSDGRFCHIIETVDDFEGWPNREFGGNRPCTPAFEAAFVRSVATARSAARGAADFREGFTIWLAGGWGSGRSMQAATIEGHADWPVVMINPADAGVLALGEAGKLRDHLRLERLRRRVEADGFTLHHPGAWLNLHAYWLENGHDLLPPGRALAPPSNLQFGLIRQAEIRARAYSALDRRAVPHPRFGWLPVSRMERQPFSGELDPIYASVDAVRRQRLVGVALDPAGAAWVEAIGPADRETTFQCWNAALIWSTRILPIWSAWSGLEASLLDFVLSIDPPAEDGDHAPPEDARVDAAIRVWPEEKGVVRIHLDADWHQGLFRSDNRAELALAAALLQAAAIGANREIDRQTALGLIDGIAAPEVRHRHARVVTRVIEALGAAGVIQPLRRMSHSAMSAEKYGSTWKVRPRDAGREVRGVEDCVALVRTCLAKEIAELRSLVARYDRAGLVVAALQAQQAALMEARTWETTARATRAIHGVEQDLRTSLEQRNQTNTIIRCSVVVAEFAQCEGTPSGGLSAGRMDLEELQAKAMALIHVADMLPALISGRQNPLLRISASGDLQSDRRFSDSTLKATATELHARDRGQADENYDRGRRGGDAPGSVEEDLGVALKAEYGVPLEILREFSMGLAHLAMMDGADVIVRRRSDLMTALAEDPLLAGADLDPLLDRLILPARDGWNDVPSGRTTGDFDVSKFDRPASLIGRPIPALSMDPDPLLVLAPAVVERALVHNMSGALGGDLQNRFWSSETMRRYASRQGARTGLEFNEAVSEAVAVQGLETWTGKSMGWCLNRKQTEDLDRLGDVDVLGLCRETNLVWVIEAKDLKLCRTLGEVARRLAGYQGQTDERGRPDALLRHLRRVAFLRDNAKDLGKRLKLDQLPKVCGLVIVRSPQPMTQLTATFYNDARVALLDGLGEIPWRTGW